MFPTRFFTLRYWAERFWPRLGGDVTPGGPVCATTRAATSVTATARIANAVTATSRLETC